MATATPAAPAPSPSAPPTGAQPTPGGDAVPVDSGPDNKPRLVKPIRPIPSLPGVYPDGDPFPPSAEATSDPAQPGARPSRGPDGRFVAASSPATTDDGAHTLEAGAPEPPPADPAKPEKFSFAGEEFASREAAEQNFKSLRGQFRPLQALGRQLGGLDKIAPTLQSAAESARAWKAEAERLRAEHANGAAPAADPAAPSPSPDPAAASSEAIDWDLYAEIKRLATDSGEPWKAEQWLVQQQERIINARVQAALDERLQPLADAEAHQEVVNRTQDLFGGLAQYTNSDGSPAFPELHDEAAAREIGKMWVAIGLPPEAALTPQGAIAAIAIYRMAKAGRAAVSGARPPIPATPVAPPAPTDAQAAADLGDGRGRPLPAIAAGPGGVSEEAARILHGLRQANATSGNRALLGFDA